MNWSVGPTRPSLAHKYFHSPYVTSNLAPRIKPARSWSRPRRCAEPAQRRPKFLVLKILTSKHDYSLDTELRLGDNNGSSKDCQNAPDRPPKDLQNR
jgi:hypothetical protein